MGRQIAIPRSAWEFNGVLYLPHLAAPPRRPKSGISAFYIDSDGDAHVLEPDGTNTELGSGAGGGGGLAIFGDGSDGDLNLDGTNTYSGLVTTSGSAPNLVYSLARDIMANDFIVAASKSVDLNGYRLYCKGTLTVNGTAHRDGLAASGISQGPGLSNSNRPLGGSQAGANGRNTAGAGNTSSGGTNITGGAGGAGGAAGGNAGGGGGGVTLSIAFGSPRAPITALTGSLIQGNTPVALNGGNGGGGGAVITA